MNKRLSKFNFFLIFLPFSLVRPISVYAEPICFMQTNSGELIDLTRICHQKPQRITQITNTSAEQPSSTSPTSETQANVQMLLAVSEEFLQTNRVLGLELLNLIQGSITPEIYELRPRCQLAVETFQSAEDGVINRCERSKFRL